jgi:NAD-dependent deacetylase
VSEQLSQVRERIRTVDRIVVLTGAGVSAESGVPTFRGGGGTDVWRGMPFAELSSARMVASDLPLVWEWFEYRRGVLAGCEPNPAHISLAQLQAGKPEMVLVTQNIDDLHNAAGSRDVLELHGNIWRGRCLVCDERSRVGTPLSEIPPRCGSCDGSLRPDVVLFGEYLPADVFEAAVAASVRAELFLVVGTSAIVYPAAELPAIAARRGAFVVDVNPEASALSALADVHLQGNAGDILPLIC